LPGEDLGGRGSPWCQRLVDVCEGGQDVGPKLVIMKRPGLLQVVDLVVEGVHLGVEAEGCSVCSISVHLDCSVVRALEHDEAVELLTCYSGLWGRR